MPDYDRMTLGELYTAAEAAGITFGFLSTGSIWVGTPPLGACGRTRTVLLIDRAIRNRWEPFTGFVELKLRAAGVEVPPCPRPC